MTPLQVSAMLGQWVAAAICLGAIIVGAVGISMEIKYKAPKHLVWISVSTSLGMIGAFTYAIATKLLGF